MIIKKISSKENFKPFTLQITFEKSDEVEAIKAALSNYGLYDGLYMKLLDVLKEQGIEL